MYWYDKLKKMFDKMSLPVPNRIPTYSKIRGLKQLKKIEEHKQ